MCGCVCLSNAHATVCIRGCCWCQPSSMPRPGTWTPPWPQPSAMVFAARRWHSCWLLERCTHAFLNIYTYVYIYMNIHVYVYMSLYIHGLLRVLRVGRARASIRPRVAHSRAHTYIHIYIYTCICVHKNIFFCLHLRSRLRFSQHRQSPRPQHLHALGSRRCCAPVGPYIKTKHDI